MRISMRFTGLIIVLLLLPSLAFADPATNRTEALHTLYKAYQQYLAGNKEAGRKGVEATLRIDPNLAYGNIVRGEIAFKDGDWATSQRYFEKGLKLLKQPDQPLLPDPIIHVTVEEVEGDARCLLGAVYVMQAQRANQLGNEQEEQKYLELGYNSLQAGLKLSPGNEMRDMAEGLLKAFRKPSER